jgi:hypothetical protein
MKNRRTSAGYKLRVYIDQIKLVKAMTDEQWVDEWLKTCTADSTFILRDYWISYLEQCALEEAETMVSHKEAA